MKPKVVYLMHIKWGWIKQRPQFLAEELSSFYDVHVFARPDQQKNSSDFCTVHNFGYPSNLLPLKIINNLLLIIFLNLFCLFRKPKYFFITDPRLVKFHKKTIFNRPLLIYDCMDNSIFFDELQNSPTKMLHYVNSEVYAINASIITFVSSQVLCDILQKRYTLNENDKKLLVVNNGLDKKFMLQTGEDPNFNRLYTKIKRNQCKLLLYVGTIDTWLQFDMLQNYVNTIHDVVVVLVGPNIANFVSHNDRLILFGKVEHNCIYNILKCADILIMPFVVNELIEAVDPVKIYEYLVCDKPILLPWYKELEKFSTNSQIDFYYGEDEFAKSVDVVINKSGKINNDVESFVYSNSWSQRAHTIYQNMKNKL